MIDLRGILSRIMNSDANETFDQATDSLEAIRDALASGAFGSPGLCYYGLVTAIPGANQFSCTELIGLGDDKFLDSAALTPYHVFVLRDAGGAAAAPQGEDRPITDYVSATGTFAHTAFTAALAVGDEVLIIHPFLIAAGGGTLLEQEGTLAADGTEQNIYLNNAPVAAYEPLVAMVDCTNMAAGDVIVLRTYYRVLAAGGLIQKDEVTLNGAQAIPLKNIELEPTINGIQVTLEQTAGVNRNYPWAVFIRS